MARTRYLGAAVACAGVVVGACGGGDPATEPTGPVAIVTVATVATVVASTAPEPSASTTEPAPAIATTVPVGDVVNADPVLVDLARFMIITDTTVYKAGTINFEVTNTSDMPHEFGIARGDSYEQLPQLPNGSIDEDALGDDYLGKTAIVDQVLSPVREISFDLEPGSYVLFCNLVVGPVSHAARGQVLSVTVVE